MNKKHKDHFTNSGKIRNKEFSDEVTNIYEKYDPIFNNSLTGVLLFNPESKILYCNSQSEQILGLSYSELINTKVEDHKWKFVNIDGAAIQQEYYPEKQIIKQKKPFQNLYLGILKPDDDAITYVLISGVPVFKDEKLEYAIVYIIDQTKNIETNIQSKEDKKQIAVLNSKLENTIRKLRSTIEELKSSNQQLSANEQQYIALNKQLLESEEKYRTLADNSIQGVIIAQDNPVRISYANKAMERIAGYTIDELISFSGNSIEELLHPDDKELFFSNFKKRVMGEDVSPFHEYRLITRSGKIAWVYIFSTLINYLGEKSTLTAFLDITDKKNAEKRLLSEQEKFRLMFENAPIAYQSLNENGIILTVNNTWLGYLGYSKNEVVGNWFGDYVHESQREMFREVFPKNIKSKEPLRNIEFKLLKKDGDILFANYNARIGRDNEGNFVQTHCVFQDFTERVLLEKEIKEREERLQNIINFSSNMFYSHTTDHRLTYVSPQVQTILGLEPEDAMVKWTTLITNNPINEKGYKSTVKAIETGEMQPPYELELQKVDGGKIWVEVREAPVIKNGKVTAIVGSLNEITKRKHAQQELIERERFLDKIIESSALSTWIGDDKGVAIRTNQACLDFFGAKKDEVIGKYCIFQDSVLIDHGYMPEIEAVFKEGKVANIIVDYNFAAVDHVNVENATHKIINSIFTPVTDDQGKVTNIIVQTIDLSEIKKTEMDLRIAKERAEESDKLKSAFLANMSHEIRTPMNGILGFTELLKQHDLSPSSKAKYIDIIQKSGERMLSTINDIIEISKIETGQIKPKPETININEILTDYYEFFNPEARAKGIKMTYSTPLENKHAVINADNMMLNSILTNLIKNAIKYTDKGTIEFGYKTKDKEVEFYVSDTGIGISQKEQKAVFERFRQSEHPKSRVYEGSGLGLAITKAFIEMMKGSLWLESEKEVGSTFYFTLPFTSITKANSKKQTEKPADITPALKTMNVLVVEDDPFGTLLLNEILEDQVNKIYSESSGAKALEVYKNNHIDIILMDIKIPDINGLSLTKQIRQTDNDVIIIAQTAYAMAGDRDKALQAGCNDYLSKPINQKELLKILNRLINLKK